MKQKQRPTSDRPRLRVNAGQALVALQALQKLAGANFPAMEAFQIAKAIATLNADINVVAIDRTRHAMAKKHGVEKDGMLSVPPEKMPAFLAEYAPVADALDRGGRGAAPVLDPGARARDDAGRTDGTRTVPGAAFRR